ncbi:MAG: hypothetical protein JNK58_02010 [Phycisphaerae bacterium]|nr:hypothetical protein [Phycisphaerae bacterium]
MKILASDRVVFVLGLVVSIGAGYPAMSQANPRGPRWTDGYEWGRLNCGHHGTYQIRSRSGCERCCALGARAQAYQPDQEMDCNRVCARAVWM